MSIFDGNHYHISFSYFFIFSFFHFPRLSRSTDTKLFSMRENFVNRPFIKSIAS